MAMTIREALEKANAALQKKVDDTLTNEVFAEVQDEEAASIYEEVYKSYTPKMYRRRNQYEGLAYPENIEIKGGAAKDGRLVVINVTKPNPDGCVDEEQVTTGKNLPALVEFGQGHNFYRYDFPTDGSFRSYMKPRPFTRKTVEHLKESKAHVSAMAEGLKKRVNRSKVKIEK